VRKGWKLKICYKRFLHISFWVGKKQCEMDAPTIMNLSSFEALLLLIFTLITTFSCLNIPTKPPGFYYSLTVFPYLEHSGRVDHARILIGDISIYPWPMHIWLTHRLCWRWETSESELLLIPIGLMFIILASATFSRRTKLLCAEY